MKDLFISISIVLFLAVAVAATVRAQGSIAGSVEDQNGDAVAGARVLLQTGSLGTGLTTVTSRDGKFSFNGLSAGTYTLRVIAEGFSHAEQTIDLSGTPIDNIKVTLAIGESHLTVTAELGQAEEKQKIPQELNIIDREELQQRVTSVVAQAGKEEVGLNMQRTSPTIGAVIVRGLTGKNVVNFVDGVRFTHSGQRGGINTFFNLNESSNLQSMEVLRGPNGAQYGSDSLAGTVNLISRPAPLGLATPEFHGEINPSFSTADRAFGSSALLSYGSKRFGGYINLAGRRVGEVRTAGGLDSHSAVTRFLGLPSTVLYDVNPGTGFQQYGGAVRLNYAPREDHNLIVFYQRSQQDDGERFDQMLGGDGNLIADLRNLMLDFGYLRYIKTNFGIFDSASFTLSYNSQREERVNQGGQGNPFGDITHQYERTSTWGGSFFLDKILGHRNSFLVGGDIYRESINSPAYVHNPVTDAVMLSRPRIPDDARFISGGVFVQDVWDAVPDRLRITGSMRYSGMSYDVDGSKAPVVSGRPLWTGDRLSTADVSGRIGGVVRAAEGLRFSFNYSRGFRYPSMTDLGTLGLTGDGYEVDHITAGALGGTIGSTAGLDAVATGLPVAEQESEFSNNVDVSVRYDRHRFNTSLTAFRLDINNAITKQALILPQGAVGQFLGSEQITNQLPSGAVFVAAASNPVLVRANFTAARLWGIEYELNARLTDTLSFKGHYTYISAEDKDTRLPPNIEGGTPPPTGFVSLRHDRRKFWVEVYSTLARPQKRLSSGDLADRRTGATRSRTQIENYFRRGACVAGLTYNAAGTCNAAVGTYTLRPTGENITQVLTRVLGPGFATQPLFTHLPGYGLANVRGGFIINEYTKVFLAFENIFDKSYRNPSWGIDGTGRNFIAQLRMNF